MGLLVTPSVQQFALHIQLVVAAAELVVRQVSALGQEVGSVFPLVVQGKTSPRVLALTLTLHFSVLERCVLLDGPPTIRRRQHVACRKSSSYGRESHSSCSHRVLRQVS